MVFIFFFFFFCDKKTAGALVKNEIMQNKVLVEELHKSSIRKFEKRRVHIPFIDSILGADLADMQLLGKCNKEICSFICVIYIHSKLARVIPFKDKEGITITNAFQKSFDESSHKPNKINLQ